MNNMFKSIKMAFKTKNIFCRILIFLWVIFCAFMTLVFFIGSAGSMGADDISVILLLYYFASTAFLMPAVSIAQGVKAVNNQKNIKFAISNIYKNKDFDNISLKNWVEQNNFYVYHFNNFSYIFKGIRSDTDEVLITNYKTGKTNSIPHKLF